MTTNQDINQAIERTVRDLNCRHLDESIFKQLKEHLTYLLKVEAEVLSFYEVALGKQDAKFDR